MSERGKMIEMLSADFPLESIRWRAQMVNNGKALALAYLDSRDVQDRLDVACGVDGWKDSYHDVGGGRTSCTIEVKINGEWIGKSDGAGVTQVEAEKGLFSDCFKRAAVKWGIGRYLYDVKNVWVACEVKQNGKFKKFLEQPTSPVLKKTKRFHASGELTIQELQTKMRELNSELTDVEDKTQLDGLLPDYQPALDQCMLDMDEWYQGAQRAIEKRKKQLKDK